MRVEIFLPAYGQHMGTLGEKCMTIAPALSSLSGIKIIRTGAASSCNGTHWKSELL